MMETAVRGFAPVDGSERIEILDVVRGFALLGIFLMNIEAMAGPLDRAITGLDPALQGLDRTVDAAIYLLVQGKFYALFSLLFGMGFAVMMERAKAAGRPFESLYVRRSLALLAIGLLHLLLVWSGDILTAYALLSLLLMALFRHVPVRWLPVWGLLLYGAPLLLIFGLGTLGSLMQLEPRMAKEFDTMMQAQGREWAEGVARQVAAYGQGSYLDATVQRARDAMQTAVALVFTYGWMVLGLFVLGCWFVRSGAITRPSEFSRLYARLRWIGLPLGLLLTYAGYRLVPTMTPDRLDLTMASAMALTQSGALLMALGYLAWIVRGLSFSFSARWLLPLAPAGRMALTHYLLQSLIGTSVFYGYGLGFFERMPRAWQPVFVLAVFALQVAISHAWLRRFRFGPAEWLWRGITYGGLPPMRR